MSQLLHDLPNFKLVKNLDTIDKIKEFMPKKKLFGFSSLLGGAIIRAGDLIIDGSALFDYISNNYDTGLPLVGVLGNVFDPGSGDIQNIKNEKILRKEFQT